MLAGGTFAELLGASPSPPGTFAAQAAELVALATDPQILGRAYSGLCSFC